MMKDSSKKIAHKMVIPVEKNTDTTFLPPQKEIEDELLEMLDSVSENGMLKEGNGDGQMKEEGCDAKKKKNSKKTPSN